MSKDFKVSKKQAELEFENFADAMDLDVDLDSMQEDDKKEFQKVKDKIIKAIMIGSLTFNDNNEPVFTPQRSEENKPLTFREPKGSTFKCMDGHKDNQNMGKMFAIMAEMTGTTAGTFSKLSGQDFKVCTAIVTVFLG